MFQIHDLNIDLEDANEHINMHHAQQATLHVPLDVMDIDSYEEPDVMDTESVEEAKGHTTPRPHYPKQPFHHLLCLNPRLHSRSPRYLPHRTVAPTIRTRRRLCAIIDRPPRSTPSTPKTSNRCGLFPSCLSHLHPSPAATLVAEFWPAVAVSLCKGPFCFDFNLSEKLFVKS
jgi:hypothetical protein